MAKKTATPATPDEALEKLISGLVVGRSIPEQRFQEIANHYNARNPDKSQGLSGVKLYIYRTFPQVDYRLGERKTANIETIECVKYAGETGGSVEVTEIPPNLREYVTHKHGGGRYRLNLNDKGREVDSVAQTNMKVDETEHPPILDYKELVTTDQETNSWILRQIQAGVYAKTPEGKLILASDRVTPLSGDAAAWAQVVSKVIDKQSEGSSEHALKRSIDMVSDTATEMIKKLSPGDPLATALSIVQAMKAGGNDGGMAAMMPLLITMIQENNKTTMAMMTMQMNLAREQTQATTNPDNGMAVVERILTTIEKFGGPSQKTSWLDGIKEMLPMVLPLILAGRAANPQQAAEIASTLAARTNGTAARPSMIDTGAGTMPAPAQVTPQQFQQVATMALNTMQRNLDGSDLASGIDVVYGAAQYDNLKAMGKDALLAGLLATTAGPELQKRPQLSAFLDDFLNYGEANNAPPDAPPPTEAGAAAGVFGGV